MAQKGAEAPFARSLSALNALSQAARARTWLDRATVLRPLHTPSSGSVSRSVRRNRLEFCWILLGNRKAKGKMGRTPLASHPTNWSATASFQMSVAHWSYSAPIRQVGSAGRHVDGLPTIRALA